LCRSTTQCAPCQATRQWPIRVARA
jgi:hypothetical protein